MKMKNTVVLENYIHHIQVVAPGLASPSMCPFWLVAVCIFRLRLEAAACAVQDWRAPNLVPDSLEVDHIDGGGVHRHPYHLRCFTLLVTQTRLSSRSWC